MPESKKSIIERAQKAAHNPQNEIKYPELSDNDIRLFAERWYRGEIFTDRQIPGLDSFNASMLSMVFMPLIMLSGDQLEGLKANPPGMLYAEMKDASPRSVNGLPMFFSVGFLSQEDAKRVIISYNRLLDAIKAR